MEEFKHFTVLLYLGWRYSMKAREGLGKAFRRIILILKSDVNDLSVSREQITACQTEATVADILCQRNAGDQIEDPYKVRIGGMHMCGDLTGCDVFAYVLLDVFDGFY